MENDKIFGELLDNCNKLYTSKSHEEIKKADEFLTNFINLENFFHLKNFLFVSNNFYTKFYACKALTVIISKNYLSINLENKVDILNNLQNILVKFLQII